MDQINNTPAKLPEEKRNIISETLDQCIKTETPNVYKAQIFEPDQTKPFLIVVIGPSGAGKDMVTNAVCQDPQFSRVITGNSRGRRFEFLETIKEKAQNDDATREKLEQIRNEIELITGNERSELVDKYIAEGWLDDKRTEPADTHIWMRARKDSEDKNQYYDALIKEYSLIESDEHHGNFYGLPMASLKDSIQSGKVPIIRAEPTAIETITDRLSGDYNILVMAIFPEDAEKMLFHINKRGNSEIRLKDSFEIISESPKISHFIIHNRWGKQAETIKKFIDVVKSSITV